MLNQIINVMITKDGKDVPLYKMTAEDYVVPKGEERSYHAVIEVKLFDQKTGDRLSIPRLQKFGKKTFETSVYANLKKMGYTVTILHNPNDWEKAQREAQAKAKAEEEAAKAKAEKEKFEAAVAAETEKRLAELAKKAEKAEKEKEAKKEKKAEK